MRQKHRNKTKGGGVALYKIREDFSIFHGGIFESIFVEVLPRNANNSKTVVGEIYREPGSNAKTYCDMYDELFGKKAHGIAQTMTRPTRVTHKTATLIDNICVIQLI